MEDELLALIEQLTANHDDAMRVWSAVQQRIDEQTRMPREAIEGWRTVEARDKARIATLETFVKEHDAWLSLQNNPNFHAMMKARAVVGTIASERERRGGKA